MRQSDSYVERARIVLKNHTSRKTLWTELQMAPFAAILALTSMTLVFGLIPLALLDSSIGLGFGFIASLIFFSSTLNDKSVLKSWILTSGLNGASLNAIVS